MPNIYKSESGQIRIEESYRAFLANWPVPAEQVTVPTREGDTFVLVCGPENAPPLVLLHGSAGNATTWIGEIADYAAHFRCYCIDMIGEPGLSAPNRPELGSGGMETWLDDTLDALELDKVSIVALSLGGWVAFHYAAAHPDRVVALAAISPAGVGNQRNYLLKFLPYLFLGGYGRRKIKHMIAGDLSADGSAESQAFQAFFDLVTRQFRPRMGALPVLSDAQIGKLGFPVFAILSGKDVLLNQEETRDRLNELAPDACVDYRPDPPHYIAETQHAIVPFLLDVNVMVS